MQEFRIDALTAVYIDNNLSEMGSLNQSFAALSDPTRLEIVVHLAGSEATVSQLVERFELTQPTITSHLNVLERAGFITRTRVAQKRVCRLRAAELARVSHWIQQLQAVFEGNYRRLDKLLLEMKQTETEEEK